MTVTASRSPYADDRRRTWRWPVTLAVAGAGAYVASLLLARAPDFAETQYGARLGPALSRPLSLLTGQVPFSVGDVLVGLYAAWVIVAGARAVDSVMRRRRRWRNALAGGLRRAARDAGIATALFYVLWGWNYARPGFAARAGWPEWEGADAAELIALTEAATIASNEAYLELHGVPDAGRPTVFADDAEDVNAALADGWTSAVEHLDLPAVFARRYGPVKRPLAGALLLQLGIAGMYFPWTAEANVVPGVPAVRAPLSMAHEQAHQRGITSEAEASFLGFVATALAPARLGRYNAAVWAHGQLGNALVRADRRAWARISATRLPGVTRDLRDLAAFLSRPSLIGRRVGALVNDRYLRANRVPGGRQNYALSARLLIEYARQHEGTLFPDPEREAFRSRPRGAR